MAIDNCIAELNEHADLLRNAATELCKYQRFKSQYGARLKADIVAMLTEIQLEIEEIQSSQDCCDYAIDNCISRCDVADLIQQKIDKLKGVEE